MLRHFFSLFYAFVFVASASTIAQELPENPYELSQAVATKTFERIKAERQAINENPEVMRTIMKEEMLPHIDYQFAAFKVLGKHFRSVPREKLSEYVKVFRSYLVTSYAVALNYYDDQEVIFEPASSIEGKKAVTVRAVIKDEGRPDIKLAFQVRKNTKTNKWKAYDLVAEGISMVDSKRSEFESVLRQEGIDKVIEIMREAIASPVDLDGETAKEDFAPSQSDAS